jgi:plasmid stability protein
MVKRTTVFLPDALHEALRQEAFRSHRSMADLIRSRLQSASRPARRSPRDPLARVEGSISNGRLSQGIDEAVYRH